MPGHEFCGLGESVTDAEHKKHRTRKVGTTFLPIHQDKPKNPNLGRPTKENKVKKLKAFPQDIPIAEHPYMRFLAEQWEEADDQIAVLKKKQDDLKVAADEFSDSYLEIKSNNKIC